jgi:type II secretory pathway component PulF
MKWRKIMTTYKYSAMDAQGKEHKGLIDGENESDANARLKEQGLFPTSINKAGNKDIEKVSKITITQTKSEDKESKPRSYSFKILGFKVLEFTVS